MSESSVSWFDYFDYLIEGWTGQRKDGSSFMLIFAILLVIGVSTWIVLGQWKPVVTPKFQTTEQYINNSKKRSKARSRILRGQTTKANVPQKLQNLEKSKQIQQNLSTPSALKKPKASLDHTVFETIRPSKTTTASKSKQSNQWHHISTSKSISFSGRHTKTTIPVSFSSSTTNNVSIQEIRFRIQNKSTMCQLSTIEIENISNNVIKIEAVHASGENPPMETAANLLQPGTSKWLDMTSTSSLQNNERWISLKLNNAILIQNIFAIHLISGNDCPERDPVSVIVEGRERCGASFATIQAEHSRPITSPITNYKDLMQWENPSYPAFNVIPLCSRDLHLRTQSSQIMVCHDMKGGYTNDDRYTQGSNNSNAYSIYHWHLIDIFVYFSHHLITIPPTQWINVTHKHGVKCYGTFITEWNSGTQLCHEVFFNTSTQALNLANALINIAHTYGFDGWLINIENNCSPIILPNILLFLQSIRSSDLEISWYDSISFLDGQIRYQNELNVTNVPFLNCVDSFFTNYRWDGGAPRRSAAAAKEIGRLPSTIFMGCDVFGRGTYGGGGFDVDVALRAAFEYNTSLAIFAPGWIYEHLETNQFHSNNTKFWCKIETAILDKNKFSKTIPLVTTLPFFTNFNTGTGLERFVYGMKCDGTVITSWSSLNELDSLPLCYLLQSNNRYFGIGVSLETNQNGAWNGASCLLLRGVLDVEKKRVDVPLYTCRCETISGRDVVVSVTFRSQYDSEICLTIGMRATKSSTLRTIVLRNYKNGKEANGKEKKISEILATTKTKVFIAPMSEYMFLETKEEINPKNKVTEMKIKTNSLSMTERATELRNQGKSTKSIASILRAERKARKQQPSWSCWKTRTFQIPSSVLNGKRIVETIGVTCVGNNETRLFDVQLGELSIKQPSSIIPGAEISSVWSKFQHRTLHLYDILWCDVNQVCFTIQCSVGSDGGGGYNTATTSSTKKDPMSIDYYYSTDELPGWTWIGRSVGSAGMKHTHRIMNLNVSNESCDMIVIGAIPTAMEEYEMTHSGENGLHLTLESGPRAVLLMK